MTLESWLMFCITEAALCLVPGPAVLFVVSVAFARGTLPGFAASFGILTGNAFYFALSATGIAALILASNEAFTVLKWAGAAYLIWLGMRMILTQGKPGDVTPQPLHRSFIRGFVVQTANPKSLVFFVALLPQFIDPAGSVGVQVLILGMSSITIELIVLALYVFAATRARTFARARFVGPLERVGGALLVAAGARLAFVRTD